MKAGDAGDTVDRSGGAAGARWMIKGMRRFQAQLDEQQRTQDELVIAAVYPLEKLLQATRGQ